MRGIAPAQILGAKVSVCHGVGGMFAASGTIIIGERADCQFRKATKRSTRPFECGESSAAGVVAGAWQSLLRHSPSLANGSSD
jgi:hypothetical protein